MKTILLFIAFASIAYSRPGESRAQIEKRFGQPHFGGEKRGTGVEDSLASGSPLSASMRETSRIYEWKDISITVYFFDNRSVREEYVRYEPEQNRFRNEPWQSPFAPRVTKTKATKLTEEEISSILTAASNGTPWQKQGDGSQRANDLTAWFEYDVYLIVETDAFRKLRISNPAEKAAKLEPEKGKGF